MRQRRWIELFSDYECEIRYYPGKANVVSNALSRKERVKPKRVRAMAMIIQSGVKRKTLAAQSEAFKQENVLVEGLHVLDQQMERKEDESLYFMHHIWVPLVGGVRTIIMDEAHKTRYSVHSEADKMFHDLRDMYWWSGIKRDIATMEKLARLYIDEIVVRHGVPVSIISDRDGRFTSCFWQTLQMALGTRLDMSTAYHPQTVTIRVFVMLRSKHCMEGNVGRPLCRLKSEKAGVALERRDTVWKEGKLAPRYVGPFEILERTDRVAYRLRLPEELSSVHDTFHVSNLKKCLADANLHVLLDEIKIDKTLRFVKEPVEIMDREVKSLKRSKIPIVEVCWNSKRGPEFTWEREDHMKAKYP
ncbi:putative reverse transcriptase domain-containing protein [Tanacetum coccineum]